MEGHMQDLKTAGFHHVTMVSGDAPRTVKFYRDVLGLGLVKRTVNFDDPSAYHLYFGLDGGAPGTLLTFFEWRGIPRGQPGIGGVHHIALGVADEAALLRWKRWLNDQGVGTSGPIDRGYFKSLYFRDPDGQILELATEGPGYAVDEPADALGTTETLPPVHQLMSSDAGQAYAASTHPEPVPALTPEMALSGIHHISAISSDVERANVFYGLHLGLTRIKRSVNQDDLAMPHHFWARYEEGRVWPRSSWSLFQFPRHWKATTMGTGQTHHVAFRAPDQETQHAWHESLLAQGVRATKVIDRTYFTSIYFHDPDGLLLEIATDGPGFAVDEDPHALGQRLALPAWLEGEREQIERALVPI
jgi:glyoxalase family protein